MIDANLASIELRVALNTAFDRLRALYAMQKDNPFGVVVQKQIEATRREIAYLRYRQHVEDVKDFHR